MYGLWETIQFYVLTIHMYCFFISIYQKPYICIVFLKRSRKTIQNYVLSIQMYCFFKAIWPKPYKCVLSIQNMYGFLRMYCWYVLTIHGMYGLRFCIVNTYMYCQYIFCIVNTYVLFFQTNLAKTIQILYWQYKICIDNTKICIDNTYVWYLG